jgi:hypothetical protein
LGQVGHGGGDGAIRPKSLERWRRLTLLAQNPPDGWILLEDANDLADFLEATGRTVPRSKWADEAIAAQQAAQMEGLF